MYAQLQDEQSLNWEALYERVWATDAIAELKVEYEAARSLASSCEFDLEKQSEQYVLWAQDVRSMHLSRTVGHSCNSAVPAFP